jgi:hypothetical protein
MLLPIGRRRSFLGHPGFAQTGEISGFVKGADLWHQESYDGPQARHARKAIIGAESPGLNANHSHQQAQEPDD